MKKDNISYRAYMETGDDNGNAVGKQFICHTLNELRDKVFPLYQDGWTVHHAHMIVGNYENTFNVAFDLTTVLKEKQYAQVV